MTNREVAVGPSEYAVIALGSAAYTCYTFTWFTLPAYLSTIIDELGLTTTQAGVLVGAIPLMYIPFGLASGLVIDRLGSRRGIAIALVVFAVTQVARGYAVDFWTMLLPTLAFGIAGTAITFGLPKLVSELFPPERTGAMSSVYQIGASLGSAAAFGLARPVLGPLLGDWRTVFVANGVVVLAYAGVWIVASSTYEARRGFGTTGGDAGEPSDEPDEPEQSFTLDSIRDDLRRVLLHRDMLLLVLIGTMYLFVNHGLRGWLATILEGRGVSPEIAGLVTSLLIVAQMAGTITVPPLSDRIERRRPVMAGCGLLCAIGTAGLLVASSVPGVVLVLVAVGVGIGGLSPLIKVIPIEIGSIGPRLTATAVSFVYAVGELGGFGGPFLIGALEDATGSFSIGVGVLVVAGLVIAAASAAMSEVS